MTLFLGSGTTLLACEQTKRICIGVEFDPEYCQTIIDRFEKLSGTKAERV
jgi:DNA modification methylase